MGDLAGWNSLQKILFYTDKTKIDDDLVDFPVPLYLAAVGSGDIDWTEVFTDLGANSKKIAVTTDDGETECYVEIEKWDDGSNEANLWIKIPNVSSLENTALYLYYDSAHSDNTTYVGDTGDVAAQNVWDSNFKAVYHMAQDPEDPKVIAVQDSFTDTDDVLLENHTPDVGGTWVKWLSFGTYPYLAIKTNRITNRWTFTTGSGDYYNNVSNISDGYVQLDFAEKYASASINSNMYFRWTNTNNYYQLLMNNLSGLEIRKKVSGTPTTIAGPTVPANWSDPWVATFYITFIGDLINVYVDDVLAISVTDSSHTTGKTGFGDASHHTFDNFEAGTFEGVSILDSTSNTNNGTPGGLMTTSDLVNGQIGNAIDFDDTDDIINFGDINDFGSGAFTLEANIKPAAFNGAVLTKYYGATGERSWLYQFNASGYQQLVTSPDGTATTSILSNTTMDVGTVFYNTAITKSGTTATFYLEGESDGGGTVDSSLHNNVNPFCIGATEKSDTTRGSFYGGIVDEVRVSDIERSAAWLKATYYSNTNNLITQYSILLDDITYWEKNNFGYQYALDDANHLFYKTSSETASTSATIDTWYLYDTATLGVSGDIESFKILSDKVYIKTDINNLIVYDYQLDDPDITIDFSIDDGDCYFFDFIENGTRLFLDRGNSVEVRDVSTFQKISSSVSKPVGNTETIDYIVKKKDEEYLISNNNSTGYILEIGVDNYSLYGTPAVYDFGITVDETPYDIYSVADNEFTIIKYNTTNSEVEATFLYFDSNNTMAKSSTVVSDEFTEVNDIFKYSKQVLILGDNNFGIYHLEDRDISTYTYPTSGYDYKQMFYLEKFYIKREDLTDGYVDFTKIIGWNSFREDLYKSHYFDILVGITSLQNLDIDVTISELSDFITSVIDTVKPVHTELLNVLTVLTELSADFEDSLSSTDEITELPIPDGGSEMYLTLTGYYDGIHPWKPANEEPLLYNCDGRGEEVGSISLWLCDSGINKIYNVQTDGTSASSFFTSVFDAGATSPQGIAAAPDGTLWIIDTGSDKVYNVQTDGTWISEFATSGSPQSISYDTSDDTLWTCDLTTDKIYNMETDGTPISDFDVTDFDASSGLPTGVSKSSDGTLWTCDLVTGKIYNVQTDGTWISEFPITDVDPSAGSPLSVSVAGDGTLWITDVATVKIYNATTTGTWISEFATSVFDPASATPAGISITTTQYVGRPYLRYGETHFYFGNDITNDELDSIIYNNSEYYLYVAATYATSGYFEIEYDREDVGF